MKCGLVVSVYLMSLSSSGLGTNTTPPSLTSQMQELEQRLLEAEQRAEDAETQVTGVVGSGRALGTMIFPRSFLC